MNRTSLIFTGDIGFDKYMAGRWAQKDLLAPEVRAFLAAGDHRIVNVEGPLCREVRREAGPLAHGMPPEVAGFLSEIGADVWNLCNNHIMDAGPEGIAQTLALAARAGARTLGAGRNLAEAAAPVIFPEAGGVGMIGVGYQRACRAAGEDTPGCLSWSRLDLIEEQIRAIRRQCRWCVVVAHAGEEFTPLPSPYTRERFLRYLEMGADVVVTHHPHVPMNYERLPGGKAIFYSLGNFIFDTDYQRAQYDTEKGVLLKLTFTEETFSFEPFGIAVDRETERIVAEDLPDIFTDVPEEEYRRLLPLSVKAFVQNTKRQMRFLYPDRCRDMTEEDWKADFYRPMRSGLVPGETLDFTILYPLSLEAEKGVWRQSELTGVVAYIRRQLEED